MVSGKDFYGFSAGMVEQDEVLQQIKKILLFADAAQHGFQSHAPLLFFFKTLPLMEERILAAQRTDFGRAAVGEHQERVIIEQMGDGVEIVRVIIDVGVLNVHGSFFQLDEQQRQTVHKADDVRAAAVGVAVNFHFLDRKKIVILRVLEIDHGGFLRFGFAVRTLDRHGDSVADEEILFFVDLEQRRGGKAFLQNRLRFKNLVVGNPRIELFQSVAKIPDKQNLPVRLPAERAVLPERFRIIREVHIPAQHVPEKVPGAFLNEYVF